MTSSGGATYNSLVHLLVTSVILGLIILATIIGNVFVIAAIVLERNLHNVANYLIASLAVADLLVAALVMPLAAVNEVSTHWFLGREACDAFTSFDVLCCTASILHLVSISLDRYWAVSRVDYIRNRSAARILIMIGASWVISAVISIPPLFGWRTAVPSQSVSQKQFFNIGNETGSYVINGTEFLALSSYFSTAAVENGVAERFETCQISQDWGYTVFSTLGAFYIPLIFMIIVYVRIYQIARARIRKKHFKQSSAESAAKAFDETTMQTTAQEKEQVKKSEFSDDELTTAALELDETEDAVTGANSSTLTVLLQSPTIKPDHDNRMKISTGSSLVTGLKTNNGTRGRGLDPSKLPLKDSKPTSLTSSAGGAELTIREKREKARERKAARTLAIITGSFIGCWLPFFIVALVGPFCGDKCHFPDLLLSVINWLGYLSSLFNPIIYNVFNPDFRSASRQILFGKYRNRH